MKCRTLGKTEENVFPIGLGTYGLGDAYRVISKRESIDILHTMSAAIEGEGKLFIDTAPLYGYGACEEWIGQFLRDASSKNVLVATKGGRHIDPEKANTKDFTPEFLKLELDKSLKRLRIKEVFLFQLHNPGLRIILEGSIFDMLEDLRDAGKIRFYGVSIDHPTEGIAAIDICKRKGYRGLAAIQVIYNIFDRSAEVELFPKAREEGIGIIAREPLCRGFLAGKYNKNNDFTKVSPAVSKIVEYYEVEHLVSLVREIQELLKKSKMHKPLSEVAIRFVLSHPSVSVVIPGTNRRDYIYSNLEASSVKINRHLMRKLKTYDQRIRVKKSDEAKLEACK